MKKKNYLFLATAALMMASCANDDLTGGSTTPLVTNHSISFNMNTSAITRATEGADAATALGNMFIVWGEKNETSGAKASDGNLVFQNYVVKHDATGESNYGANTTTSNTAGWEYVGIDHSDFDTNVKNTIGSGKAQTIKYWDDNASSYTFTAISALESDIKAGNVTIEKNEGSSESGKTVYDKGYTVKVGANANTGNIYYADRVNIEKGTSGYNHNAVKLTFRSFQSKIRFGIWENIPGYKVVITDVTYNNTKHPGSETSDDSKKFGVDGKFVKAGDNTSYTVTYEDDKSSNTNKVKVATAANSATEDYFVGGTNILNNTTGIGTNASSPTWDIENGGYTPILPNPSNLTNMTLTISYKLISEDTNEIIEVSNKKAEVPAEYCQWKSNYAYTYLFKITNQSADLYPITFDACIEEDETGNQETITEVTTPSITTFGAKTTDGKTTIVKDGNEYAADDVIYATVVEDGKVVALSSSNTKLYKVSTTSTTDFPITEASVAHALSQTEGTTTKITAKPETLNDNSFVTIVPTEDGKNVTLSNSGAALKWTATDKTVYAIEYSKTVDNKTTKTYKIVKIGGAENTTQGN